MLFRSPRQEPATRTFQALRIHVNRELEELSLVLPQCVSLLNPGGRLVVVSFHSLEDRIVKRFLVAERRGCTCPPEVPVCVCGRSPRLRLVAPSLTATDAEIAANPRARSARLVATASRNATPTAASVPRLPSSSNRLGLTTA